MKSAGIHIYDIYDWWYEPFWYQAWFKVVLSTLIVIFSLIIIYLIILAFKRRKKVPQDPWTIALQQLNTINLSLFEDPETHKIFYTHLVNILKNYLSKRFSMKLEGKTDQEIIQHVQNSELPVDLQDQVKSLFNGAEIIRFAHQESASERMRYDLLRAIDIVRNTIPKNSK